jgi:D-arginine dehydrogenase
METYGTAHTRALTRASRDFFLEPPANFCEHPILSPRGVLYVGQDGQADMLETACNAYQLQGLQFERLSAREAVERVPCLLEDRTIGAIFDPIASDMDVDGLHQGFLRGMRQHGASLLCDAALRSARHEQDSWTLQTASATLRAKVIVDAAGAWADPVAAACGVGRLGIQPMRRSAFLFPGPEDVDFSHWPTVVGADESYYFKPDAGAMLGSPANADPVPPQDAAPDEIDIATGIYRIEEATTLRIRRPSHVWAGLRSFAPDREFVIGWDAVAPGFFWLAGQGGYGIQTAAGASELAAALLLGRPVPQELTAHGVAASAVDPARFSRS